MSEFVGLGRGVTGGMVGLGRIVLSTSLPLFKSGDRLCMLNIRIWSRRATQEVLTLGVRLRLGRELPFFLLEHPTEVVNFVN